MKVSHAIAAAWYSLKWRTISSYGLLLKSWNLAECSTAKTFQYHSGGKTLEEKKCSIIRFLAQ